MKIYPVGLTTITWTVTDIHGNTNSCQQTVTVQALPVADHPDDVTACDSYTLPALTNGNYYTAPGGTGTPMSAGDIISSTTTLYVYTPATAPCVNAAENSFLVTINNSPVADHPDDVAACESYTLPVLIKGNYFTEPGGAGTAMSAGDIISSTTTLYVYTPATAPCEAAENSFLVTINHTPVADHPDDVTACDSYTLPALTNGNYFTEPGGAGTAMSAGDIISSTTTLYVYTPAIAPCVAAENSFLVTINHTPVADHPDDVTACDSYSLPALTNGNYFTEPGGAGTAMSAGDIISSTTTLYVYTPAIAPCVAAENSFLVTINHTPVADDPDDVAACESYTLPALTNGNYYTAPGRTGSPMSAGDIISSTTTLYVYTPATAPCVAAENSFLVTINHTPVADDPDDVAACDSYTLPALTNGNYFTEPGGAGTAMSAGDIISSTTTLYVYTPATAPCVAAENSFLVTINHTPVADNPDDVAACESYTLPALTNGNYYTATGGTGAAMSAGDIISSTTTLYVYTPAIAPCVAAENSFLVTINHTPVADHPIDVTACDSYTLPALLNGNYYTAPDGTGAAMSAGDIISSTTTLYVYTPATAPCVAAENSFLVTINHTPVADHPIDVTACDSYTLPALTNGNYYTGPGGTGTPLSAGDIISSTTTLYVYTPATAPCVAAENSFLVTINHTPVADNPDDVAACESYTLPALTNGNYYTATGGTGAAMSAGDIISSTTTLYVYTPAIAPCVAAENSFLVTINHTPVADHPIDVTACDSYTLPALLNGNYYTATGGTGAAMSAGDIISSTTTLYVYTPATAPCVAAENSFLVTINHTPVADHPIDVTACDSYTLPALTNGNYYTGPGGTGTPLSAGDIISSTTTLYVYTPATAPCVAADNSFLVTINPTLSASVSIAASANPVPAGTSVTFTATPTNGGSSPTYQWYKNSVAVATGATYTYIPVNNDVVYVMMTSNATPCLAGSPATSNSVTMNVYFVGTASVSIVASSNPVCSGTPVTFTATPVNGGTPSYQWYRNGSPVGSNLATYTYTPTNNNQVYVIMTSSLFGVTGSPATSNIITMSVNSPPSRPGNFTASTTSVCRGAIDVVYTVPPVTGATSYIWSYTGSRCNHHRINKFRISQLFK